MVKVKQKIRTTYVDLEKEIVPVGFDLVFKKIFGIRDNNKYIKHLLKKILKKEPKNIKILNSEFIGDNYNEKDIVVDFIVEIDAGDKIGIELNSVVNTSIINRNFLYMARIAGGDLDSGKDYSELHNHTQINFDFKGHHSKPIGVYKLMEVDEQEILTDVLTIIRIDVPYFVKRCYNEDAERLDSLTKFIGLMGIKERKILDKIVKGDAIMAEIYEKAKEFSKDEKIIGAYNLEEHRRKVMLSEIKEGYQEGKIDEKINIVKNLLNMNIDIASISKATGLSVSEINNLN